MMHQTHPSLSQLHIILKKRLKKKDLIILKKLLKKKDRALTTMMRMPNRKK